MQDLIERIVDSVFPPVVTDAIALSLVPVKREYEITSQGGCASVREKILALENALYLEMAPNAIADLNAEYLTNDFAPGVYARTLRMKAGMVITGRIHKHAHHNFVMSGVADVFTEFGSHRIVGPCHFVSVPGTKRALRIIEDMVWTTVHANPDELRDETEILNDLTVDDYSGLAKDVTISGDTDFEGVI